MYPDRGIVRTYVQMFRRYIYKTRQPAHPHSPIRKYEQRPQGPPPRPRYMKSCPDTALLYATSTSTSTATSTTSCIAITFTITARTAQLCQYPAHHRISCPTLVLSSASAVSLVTVFNLIRLTIFGLIRLNCGYNLTRLTCFFYSIRLSSNVFIFNTSHTNRITSQSGFRDFRIGQSVFGIFQH